MIHCMCDSINVNRCYIFVVHLTGLRIAWNLCLQGRCVSGVYHALVWGRESRLGPWAGQEVQNFRNVGAAIWLSRVTKYCVTSTAASKWRLLRAAEFLTSIMASDCREAAAFALSPLSLTTSSKPYIHASPTVVYHHCGLLESRSPKITRALHYSTS